MRVTRFLVWPIGLSVLTLMALVVRGLPGTTYGGSQPWLLWLEGFAAIALLVLASLQTCARRQAALAVAG